MQQFDPGDAKQLRRLAHELSEALTATCAYLHASQRHEGAKLRKAISDATEQIDRAGQIVLLLRAILGTAVAYTVTHEDTAFYVRKGDARGRIVATFSNGRAAELFMEKQMATEAAHAAFD